MIAKTQIMLSKEEAQEDWLGLEVCNRFKDAISELINQIYQEPPEAKEIGDNYVIDLELKVD